MSDSGGGSPEVVTCSNNPNTEVDDCPYGACDEKDDENCDDRYDDYMALGDGELCKAGSNANYYLVIEETPDEPGWDQHYLIVDCQNGTAETTVCSSGAVAGGGGGPRYECT